MAVVPSSYCKFGRVRTKVCLKGRKRCDHSRCTEFQPNAKYKKEHEPYFQVK